MRLIIKKETAVKLFEALGFKTADTWDETRLLKKVKQLPRLADESKIENPKIKKILKKIMKADKVVFKEQEQEEKIEQEPERPSERAMRKLKEKEIKEMSKKTKTKKTKKKATTKKKEVVKKDKVEKDAFGRRLGTQGALINEHFDKKGKTIEQLTKETKLSKGRISNHVRDFVAKGYLKKSKDGKYALTGKTK